MSLILNSGTGTSSFQQQGQLDWVALSRTTVQLSLGALARYSKAGVDPLTLSVGRVLCRTLNLESDTQEQICQAIQALQKYPGYNKILWFGFGLRSVPEELAETDQGLALYALCASLSTSYDSNFVAKVLRHLCVISAAPHEMTPSLQRWRSLVECLEGGLTATKFVRVISGFQRIMSSFAANPVTFHESCSALALADVIVLLGRVSTPEKELFHVTISGGFDCAFVAAFAEWILSLPIEIRLSDDSVVYRTGYAIEKTPRVTFIYQTASQVASQGPEFTISRISHQLHSGADILFRDASPIFSNAKSCVRTHSLWSNILHDTFHGSFKHFLKFSSHHFGVYLKCISIVADTMLKSETEICKELTRKQRSTSRSEWSSWPKVFSELPARVWLHDRARGEAFLQFAHMRLPELESCVRIRDEVTSKTAQEIGEQAVKAIGLNCHCSAHQGDSLEVHDNFCSVILADVIVVYLWILIMSSIDDAILPSSNGLLGLYLWHESLYDPRGPFEYEGTKLLGVQNCLLDLSTCFFHYPLGGIDLVFYLFGGTVVPQSEGMLSEMVENLVVRSGAGICVYYKFMENPSLPPEEVLQIKIIPGHLSYDGSLYQKAVEEEHSVPLPGTDGNFPLKLFPNPKIVPVIEETTDMKVVRYAQYITKNHSNLDFCLSFLAIQRRFSGWFAPLDAARCSSLHVPRVDAFSGEKYALGSCGSYYKLIIPDAATISDRLRSEQMSSHAQRMLAIWFKDKGGGSSEFGAHLEIVCDSLLALYAQMQFEWRHVGSGGADWDDVPAYGMQMLHFTTCIACILEQAWGLLALEKGYWIDREGDSPYLNPVALGAQTPLRIHFRDNSVIEVPWSIDSSE